MQGSPPKNFREPQVLSMNPRLDKIKTLLVDAKDKVDAKVASLASPTPHSPSHPPLSGHKTKTLTATFTDEKLGLTLQRGLLCGRASVAAIEPGGAAETVGVRVGDAVVSLSGGPGSGLPATPVGVDSYDKFLRLYRAARHPGRPLVLTFARTATSSSTPATPGKARAGDSGGGARGDPEEVEEEGGGWDSSSLDAGLAVAASALQRSLRRGGACGGGSDDGSGGGSRGGSGGGGGGGAVDCGSDDGGNNEADDDSFEDIEFNFDQDVASGRYRLDQLEDDGDADVAAAAHAAAEAAAVAANALFTVPRSSSSSSGGGSGGCGEAVGGGFDDDGDSGGGYKRQGGDEFGTSNHQRWQNASSSSSHGGRGRVTREEEEGGEGFGSSRGSGDNGVGLLLDRHEIEAKAREAAEKIKQNLSPESVEAALSGMKGRVEVWWSSVVLGEAERLGAPNGSGDDAGRRAEHSEKGASSNKDEEGGGVADLWQREEIGPLRSPPRPSASSSASSSSFSSSSSSSRGGEDGRREQRRQQRTKAFAAFGGDEGKAVLVREQARRQWRNHTRDHLVRFLVATKNQNHDHALCTYEEWLCALHPTDEPRWRDPEDGAAKKELVDIKFYSSGSDHLSLWRSHAAATTSTQERGRELDNSCPRRRRQSLPTENEIGDEQGVNAATAVKSTAAATKGQIAADAGHKQRQPAVSERDKERSNGNAFSPQAQLESGGKSGHDKRNNAAAAAAAAGRGCHTSVGFVAPPAPLASSSVTPTPAATATKSDHHSHRHHDPLASELARQVANALGGAFDEVGSDDGAEFVSGFGVFNAR